MIQSSNASVLQKIGLPTCVHDYAFSSRRPLVADAEPAADRRAGGWVALGAGAGTCLAPAGSGVLRELLLVHGWARRGRRPDPAWRGPCAAAPALGHRWWRSSCRSLRVERRERVCWDWLCLVEEWNYVIWVTCVFFWCKSISVPGNLYREHESCFPRI